jgi:alpha,alpha-trehalose phosphorylase
MRDHGGELSFAPRLPQRLTRLAFGMRFCGRQLKVEIEHGHADYSLRQGSSLRIVHHGRAIEVPEHEPVRCPIPAIAVGEAPRQPRGRRPARRQTSG